LFDNYKNPEERDFITAAVIGDKAQGKSSFLALFAKEYHDTNEQNENPRRVLIHDPSEAWAFQQFENITVEELTYGVKLPKTGKRHFWRKGIRRITGEDDDEMVLRSIRQYMRNGLVIFDEARDWMKENPQKWQKELFTKHRNLGLDLVFVFHNFMDIPISLRPHIWMYILFKTPEKPDGPQWFSRRRFPNPDQFYKKWEEVELKQYHADRIIQEYAVFEKTFDSVVTHQKEKHENK
jgi:zonular occludens toxin Zot